VGTTASFAATRSAIAVHPHGCGDNDVVNTGVNRCDRFTPTGVGTTRLSDATPSLPPVHPHGCGDNNRQHHLTAAVVGSPPRVWGQRLMQPGQIPIARFTPTGVGTTCTPGEDQDGLPVHPHGCGDNDGGTRIRHGDARFTPTGVGTTILHATSGNTPAVHPHGCGDNAASR